jgi:hypothetical protein
MEFGVSIFFTECSISPTELAVAVEERGFDSLWDHWAKLIHQVQA